MATLLIIADDLSGTADCAVGCATYGLHTVVTLTATTSPGHEADIIAADADSRRLAPAAAARANVAMWQAHGHQARFLYKKIDSTLRGNVAAEVAALTAHAGMALAAPAFPATGRTTRHGRQWLDGVPVEETDVWRNEQIDGRADLLAMFKAQGLRTALLELDALRAMQPAALGDHLMALQAQGVEAVVLDSETDNDLALIAHASRQLHNIFWVGSAGLAAQLAGALDFQHMACQAASSPTPLPAAAGPTLTVVGSMSQVSQRQAAQLCTQVGEAMTCLDISAALLREPPVSKAQQTFARQVETALANGRDVTVTLVQDATRNAAEGLTLCTHLAALLAPSLRHAGALIATGGETARAILCAADIDQLRVIEQIETGMPLSTAKLVHNGHIQPLQVITKAGGFGRPDTLFNAWRHLARDRQSLSASNVSSRSPRQAQQENQSMTYRPVIGITMGDAAGVGPEIIVKSLAHEAVYATCRPLVIGDAGRLRDAARRLASPLDIHVIESPVEARFTPGVIDCIDLGLIPADLPYGQVSPIAGDAAYQYIARTVELTQRGELDAICTAPLNKEALHAGGHVFPGHTELLAHLTGIDEVSMMLVTPKMKVIHVTTHIGLIDAINRIEPGLVSRTIERAHDTLVRAGVDQPRIGVCGINPHAGENGLFGYGEEEEKIVPAIEALTARGWDVEGPLPADTLFFRAGRGDFDVVVAMYHDQGHGPVKVMGLEAGVNVTVGLPVIRTSVDHGTAFDIAGKGIADERSMLEAFRQAIELASRRNKKPDAA